MNISLLAAKKILGKSKSYARAVTHLVSASSGGLPTCGGVPGTRVKVATQ